MANQFDHQQYISLETFRKNGVGVKTPVWFVEFDQDFYVWTDWTSGKAKRIRGNPQVNLAPSTGSGEIKGNWISGEARFVSLKEEDRIRQLFLKKYGLLLRLFDILGSFQKLNRKYIRIQLKEPL